VEIGGCGITAWHRSCLSSNRIGLKLTVTSRQFLEITKYIHVTCSFGAALRALIFLQARFMLRFARNCMCSLIRLWLCPFCMGMTAETQTVQSQITVLLSLSDPSNLSDFGKGLPYKRLQPRTLRELDRNSRLKPLLRETFCLCASAMRIPTPTRL